MVSAAASVVEEQRAALRPSLIVLLAAGAGLSVASLYYNQPILGTLAADLGASAAEVGAVPMSTQIGYAAGILLFAPLGDRYDRRRVIVGKAAALVIALVAAALAPSIAWLWGASLAIGLSATAAQDFVPAAAALASPESRGKTVGKVMTGLLLGILLSRLVSGLTSDHLGWRAVFFGAAALVAVMGVVAAARLPRLAPTTGAPYVALLRSLVSLPRDLAPLRRAAITQGLLSVAFSGFWSTLALALEAPPYGLSSTVAGAFGIAGAAGALGAPIAGALADRRGPAAVIRLGAALCVASFVLMGVAEGSIAVLVLGTVIFDLGVQASLIAHQTIIYGLDPSARSRINAVLVSAMFVGMAAGAFAASRALEAYGWGGVCVFCAVMSVAALALRVKR